jgi:hypothetical protein
MPAQQHTIQKRMVETIDRQLADEHNSWVLKMGPNKLRMVRSFILSFIIEPGDTVIPYMDFPEPENVTLPEPNQPAVAELAERLAKVEDRLAREEELRLGVDSRIDKVAEIIGERVSGLVDEIGEHGKSLRKYTLTAHIEKIAESIDGRLSELDRRLAGIENGDAQDYAYALKGLDEVRLRAGLGTMQAEHPRGPTAPAFPTGGAHTMEGATNAVLPVPQRGDRVRLEGALSLGGSTHTGWFDVTGNADGAFQIDATNQAARPVPHVKFTVWVAHGDPGLKEVRHADHI